MPQADSISLPLEKLIQRFAGLVRKLSWQHGLSEAEVDEVMQDVRIRLWRALGETEKIQEVNTSYMYQTVTSAALDLIRRRRSRRETPVEMHLDRGQLGEEPSGPERDLENQELSAQLFDAVSTLPEARRPVVRMHLAGYHRNEIAELLGWSEAKTRNLLYRGLADLRDVLTKRGVAAEYL
jgi:RNA polymerase sigma-70 factor (ECF subfamily)